jgi:hypothetical protein
MQAGAGDIVIHCSIGAVVLTNGDRVDGHSAGMLGCADIGHVDHWSLRASEKPYGLPASASCGKLKQTLKSKR